MYSFILMLRDWILNGNVHWFVIFYIFILIRWLVVFVPSLFYKGYECDNRNFFVTVIIPVVDEPIDFFRMVLTKVLDQKPDEVIIAVNGPENPEFMAGVRRLTEDWCGVPEHAEARIKTIYTPVPGKRNAIRLGLEETDKRSDIIVLVDSDVLWTKDTLKNLLMPFSADEAIGGVTTRQKIYKPGRHLVTMVAGILEELRAEGTMKAMSATGKVGCLPGRTIAFRTEILREIMPEFMTETFMGFHKEVSDDRSLTNLTLKLGYKTVMQESSLVYTDAPATWKKFIRQQLRWAEGSQYNNLRMTPWMLRNAPLMLVVYWMDMLMPFMLFSVLGNNVLCALFRALGYHIPGLHISQSLAAVFGLIVLGSIVGFGGRNIRSFRRLPLYYILVIPVLTLVLSFVLAPIRILGLMKCADGLGWGTRDTGKEADS
ncbi:MAG: glycosyltransferase [Oscillospiraceae bacterium]|nr:glycosyltransferase [Oscillospiraceae bacterium]